MGARWERDHLMRNRVSVHRLGFTRTAAEVYFCDQNGRLIEIVSVPSHLRNKKTGSIDLNLPAAHAWCDLQRERLAKQYPAIRVSFHKNCEEPRMYRPAAGEGGRPQLDVVWERANMPVEVAPNVSKTRIEFARDTLRQVFRRENLVGGEDNFDFEKLFDFIVYGLAGVESGFNTSTRCSSADACGVWQLTHGKIYKIRASKACSESECSHSTCWTPVSLKKKERKDFKKATLTMAYYFVSLYRRISQDSDVKTIISDYKLTPEERNSFVTALVINAYNTGEDYIVQPYNGRTLDSRDLSTVAMARWFKTRFTPEILKGYLGNPPYGENLYTFMSMAYAASANNAGYGEASREYYFKVRALAELMKEKETAATAVVAAQELPLPYTPPLAPSRPPEPPKIIEPPPFCTQKAVAGIAGVGLGVAAAATVAELQLRQQCTRRQFLGLFGVSLGAAGAGCVAGRGIANRLTDGGIAQMPPRANGEIQPTIAETQPLPTKNEDQAVLREVRRALARLRVKPLKDSENNSDADRMGPYMVAWSRLIGLPAMETDRQISEEISRPSVPLKRIPEVSPFFRCVQIGSGRDDQNNLDYLVMVEGVPSMLQEVYEEFNRLAREAGLPPNYRIRPVITSASRSQQYQASPAMQGNEQATGGETSHKFRNTFDFTVRRFDVVRLNAQGAPVDYVEMFSPDGDFVHDYVAEWLTPESTSDKLRPLFIRALINLCRRGKLVFLVEHNKVPDPRTARLSYRDKNKRPSIRIPLTCHTMHMPRPEDIE